MRKPNATQPPSIFPVGGATIKNGGLVPINQPKMPQGLGPVTPGLSHADPLTAAIMNSSGPKYAPLPGNVGQAFDMASALPPPAVPEIQPAPVASAPQAIEPVPIEKVDGKGRLRELMQQAYRAIPGDTADTLSKRIGALSDLTKNIDSLGNITPDDAEAIFDGWYRSVMKPEAPFAQFSPEAQQAIEQAYGGTIPQPRIAGAGDINHDELNAVAAYTLANFLTGKGQFGDILKGASTVMGNAQKRADMQTTALQAEDEMRRKKAIARLQGIEKVDEFNREQTGYQAKGDRDAKRQIDVQGAITDRQRSAEDTKFKHQMASQYFDFLAKGDSARAADVKAYTENALGTKLDDRFEDIDPTAQQANTQARTATEGLNQQRLQKVIEGLGIKNDLDKKSFQSELQKRIDQGSITHEQLEKIRKEIQHLPEKYRLEKLKIETDATATKTRATAALAKANKAGGTSTDKAVKSRLDGLKAIVSSYNTVIDNLSQRHSFWLEEIDKAEYDLEKAKRRTDMASQIPALQRKLDSATEKRNQLSKEMSDARDKTLQAAEQIDKLTMGGKP